MKTDTRRFARRQRTWLRKVEGAQWCDPGEAGPIEQQVEDFMRSREGA
jgi:tRNA A37 N6-isopentenylltransferase MiaA